MKNEINIFSRHSIRSDGEMGLGNLKPEDTTSENFPALTKEGEEKIREIARDEYAEVIDNMETNGILFLGGSSEEGRTKESANVIGNEMSNLYKDNKDILVLDKNTIQQIQEDAKGESGKILKKLEAVINNNPDKKIIIVYPLFLKEFSLRPVFRNLKDGQHSDFSKKIFSKVGYNEQLGFIEWLNKDAEIKQGQSANDVSLKQLKGLQRLREFAEIFSQNRQLCAGFIGHGWNLDALALYYANGGKVDKNAFKELFDNKIIGQAETGWVELKDGETVLHYKDKIFNSKE